MNWFWFALTALLFWSGSDILAKLGCYNQNEKNSHLKMVAAVGTVMGAHALYQLTAGGIKLTGADILKYLPVSFFYISSMALGYLALRYIELSISSPVCNCSGAVVAVLCLITGETLEPLQLAAVGLICIGVIALGFVEMYEDDETRALRYEKSNVKYTKSLVAFIIPLIYCILDALGTFADGIVLRTLDEEVANTAYELTFFGVGVVCFIYLLLKKEKFTFKEELPKYAGALCETIGQFAYVFALSGENTVVAAPMISAYCLLSVVWGRVFLKEKLSLKHYLCIACATVGIIILGIYDG